MRIPETEPAVGDVYEDLDKRMAGRKLKIVGFAAIDGDPTALLQSPSGYGMGTEIRLRRLRSYRFRRVEKK